MNERDAQLVHTISAAIECDGGSSTFLVHARYTNLVRVNLVLLKALLEVKKLKGVMITIDRPHQYVSHLMQLHGVDQTNLLFVDTISSHSSDTKGGAVAPEFERGPFQIEMLPDYLSGSGDGGRKPALDMGQVEFVIIDNVSTLLTYNTMESIKKFFWKYRDTICKTSPKGIQTILVMDKDLHPDLFMFIAALSKKAIDLSPDFSIMSVGVAGMALPGLQQTIPEASADQGIPRNKEVM